MSSIKNKFLKFALVFSLALLPLNFNPLSAVNADESLIAKHGGGKGGVKGGGGHHGSKGGGGHRGGGVYSKGWNHNGGGWGHHGGGWGNNGWSGWRGNYWSYGLNDGYYNGYYPYYYNYPYNYYYYPTTNSTYYYSYPYQYTNDSTLYYFLD